MAGERQRRAMNQSFWTAISAIGTLAGVGVAIWVGVKTTNFSNVPLTPAPPSADNICKSAIVSQCREDIRSNVQNAVLSCQQYVDCDPNSSNAFALLGQANRASGRLGAAQYAYEKELALGQKNNNEGEIATAYHNLAVVYSEQDSLNKAENALKKALEINIKSNNQTGQGANYNVLGGVYLKRGNLVEAESNFTRAVEILDRVDDKVGLGNAYIGLGYLKLRNNDLIGGCSYLKKAREVFSKAKYPRGISEVDNHLSRTGCLAITRQPSARQ